MKAAVFLRGGTLVAALAVAIALAGCAELEKLIPASAAPAAPVASSAPSSVPSIFRRSSADELVNYLARLKAMNENALGAEAARQRQVAQRSPTDVARIKAAMALTVSGAAEEGDILTLVDPLARRETSDPDVRAMASFLQGIAQERRRLKESAAAAGVKLRDAQRARETEKQRAEALQERAAQLQQKLDALTDLEKSLSDRQNPPR
jgi:hypothetical protein